MLKENYREEKRQFLHVGGRTLRMLAMSSDEHFNLITFNI